jgi:hypothetical protein
MPLGGFGNLIALPLQGRAREAGHSVFVDEALRPYDDQWAFLSMHRQHAGKSDVLVVDYVDGGVPVLARMATKRRAGYRSLGYLLE